MRNGTVMAVNVTRTHDGLLRGDAPSALFSVNRISQNLWAASPDGEKFLLIAPEEAETSPIMAIVNWKPKP